MIKRLFIAEKPSLAKAIVAGLGGNAVRKNGYYEAGDDVVTYNIGHLLENKMPDEINPAYKRWDMSLLPMQLTPLQLKPKPETESQLKVIGSLLSEASVIVNAGDPDEEGQLLIDEVLEYYGIDPDADNVLRIYVNDTNLKPVQAALANLKPNREYMHWRHTARARSGADYIYGMNFSRAYSLKARQSGYAGKLSVGRVQTPMFGLIVKRHRLHNAFKGTYFYKLTANVGISGKTVLFELIPPENAPVDTKGRILDKKYAESLAERLSGKSAVVKTTEMETKNISAPLLFSLLKLQVRMGTISDMGSDEVLKHVQSLYETHQAASYPRTDNRHISESQWGSAKETLAVIAQMAPSLNDLIKLTDYTIKSKAVNNDKISAHTAIIPVVTTIKKLNEKELAVYSEVARYYVAQFMPDKENMHVTAELNIDGLTFMAKAKKVKNPGWSVVLSDSEESEEIQPENDELYKMLTRLKTGEHYEVIKFTLENGKTTPPPLYTEATLMDDLPNIRKYVESDELKEIFRKRDKARGGDNGGIGTPATRSGIFASLKKSGLFDVVKKKLIPTKAGDDFFDALPSIAVNPDMTALWSVEQERIAAGKLTTEKFIQSIEKFVAAEIEIIRGSKVEIAVYSCPDCTKTLRKIECNNSAFWACTGYRDIPQCKITFPDYKGEPDVNGKGKEVAEAKKAKALKVTTCPECQRRLKRFASKKVEGEFYWSCEGLFDKEKPCKTFFPDISGKPQLKPVVKKK